MDDKHFGQTWSVWKSTPLMRNGSVQDIPFPTDYQLIEDLSEVSPPSFSGAMVPLSKAERVFQLGDVACAKVLRTALQDLGGESKTKPIVLCVDLTTHTGDMAKAFISEALGGLGKGIHMYYSGFSVDDTAAPGLTLERFVFFLGLV